MPQIITAAELRAVLGVGSIVPDATLNQVIDTAEQVILPQLKKKDPAGQPINYAAVAAVNEVVLAASVELYRVRTASGGNINNPDLTVSPFALGPNFFTRYEGVLAPYLDMGWFG